MENSLNNYFALGAAALVLVGLLTPIMRKLAIKIGAFDKPNASRKAQTEPVPYLGGIAIVIGVVSISYIAILSRAHSGQMLNMATSVFLPAVAIAIMGLMDDLFGLEAWPRLAAQTGTAILVAIYLISTNTIGTPLTNNFLNGCITAFWIVGVCNAINFFDNLDGGAAGTVAVITIFLFLISFQTHQILVSALAIVTAGSTLGFLFWNRSPARIYMGDAGALFLGIILSVLTIRLNPGITPRAASLAIPLLLMAVPILDTTVAVTSRIHGGISPLQGGRDHLSHRLLRLGLGTRRSALALWSLTAIFGAFALIIYRKPEMLAAPIAFVATALWTFLLVFFLRIPSVDATATK